MKQRVPPEIDGSGSVAPEAKFRQGQAALDVEMVFRESTSVSAWAASPMKILVPRSRGTSVWAYTSSFGGGLVAGDETGLTLRIGPEARCFFGTQASTKIYRNPDSLPCSHKTHATLDGNSLLVFTPDPVQAFADSAYVQHQEFHLKSGAGLVLLDWFTSGRAARGERWAFNSFQSRNEVFVDGERVFLDSLLLDPADGEISGPHRMGRFNCLALMLLIGAPLRTTAEAMVQEISSQPVTKRAATVSSASMIAEGAVVRVAGEDTESVGRELHRHLAFIGALLGDDPWERKW
jgi:urease accessory protein